MLEVMFMSSGNEYPAVVEFATFQKVPKKKAKKGDAKKGTIEQGTNFTMLFTIHETYSRRADV